MTDDQLAVAIPTAFPELLSKSRYHEVGEKIGPHSYSCAKCHQVVTNIDIAICPVEPTIDVTDWNVAKRIVSQVPEVVLMQALFAVWGGIGKCTDNFRSWLAVHATSADYLRAALEAVKGVE